jgi:hypothetical protein
MPAAADRAALTAEAAGLCAAVWLKLLKERVFSRNLSAVIRFPLGWKRAIVGSVKSVVTGMTASGSGSLRQYAPLAGPDFMPTWSWIRLLRTCSLRWGRSFSGLDPVPIRK